MQRPPIPPFDHASALKKVKSAEAAWNTRDPEAVAQAYTPDSEWRNRNEFFQGRDAIKEFLTRKWAIELHYRLMKELWAYTDNRISVRFEYEWQHAKTGQWYRTHGNEHWEFNDSGYMRRRDMSANDMPIDASERRILAAPSKTQVAALVKKTSPKKSLFKLMSESLAVIDLGGIAYAALRTHEHHPVNEP